MRKVSGIVKVFYNNAKKYLKDEYEAVDAVHNDENHFHAHLIFNSVNLVTAVKYEYRKGEWNVGYSLSPISFAKRII